jgi:hypothetical protein
MRVKKNRWYAIKWRSFSSFFLTFSSLVILLSGVVLFIAPPGRYANAAEWRILGLGKGEWEALHTLLSYVAVVFSVVHLVLNWKVLVHYLWDRTKHAFQLKREFSLSILLLLVVCFGSVFSWSPFEEIMRWGENLSAAWEIEDARFVAEGTLPVVDGDVEAEGFAGGSVNGWGRYTVADICADAGVSPENALKRLKSYQINAESGSRVRTLADSYGFEPAEIVDIILGQPLGTSEE